jgi:hypothetical protein
MNLRLHRSIRSWWYILFISHSRDATNSSFLGVYWVIFSLGLPLGVQNAKNFSSHEKFSLILSPDHWTGVLHGPRNNLSRSGSEKYDPAPGVHYYVIELIVFVCNCLIMSMLASSTSASGFASTTCLRLFSPSSHFCSNKRNYGTRERQTTATRYLDIVGHQWRSSLLRCI